MLELLFMEEEMFCDCFFYGLSLFGEMVLSWLTLLLLLIEQLYGDTPWLGVNSGRFINWDFCGDFFLRVGLNWDFLSELLSNIPPFGDPNYTALLIELLLNILKALDFFCEGYRSLMSATDIFLFLNFSRFNRLLPFLVDKFFIVF